jgi:hypothetical protein
MALGTRVVGRESRVVIILDMTRLALQNERENLSFWGEENVTMFANFAPFLHGNFILRMIMLWYPLPVPGNGYQEASIQEDSYAGGTAEYSSHGR